MFSIKRAIKWASLSLCATVLLTSCSSDDTTGDDSQETTAKPFVLSLAIQGSDNTFTYYTVPFEDVMSGSLSAVGQGIEQPGYYDFTKIDNTIYSIGGLDDVNVVGINQDENYELSQIGDVSFENSLSDIVEGDSNTLVAVSMAATSDVVTFYMVDKNSVTVAKKVTNPITDLTDVDVPAYSGMKVVGDYLFLSYYVSDPVNYDTNYTDKAQIAVYSYPELAFEKVITDDRVGPIGGFNVKSGLIKDENGDLYAVSHSNPANGFSKSTKPSGILRIKNGETTFDANYFFDIETASGGFNTAHLKYLGNGKAFSEINVASRADQGRWSDSPLKSAVVDLYNKTVTYIDGVPQHNGDGRRLPALYDNGFVYLCIPGDTGIYVYKMDVNNYTAEKGAEVEANFVAGFFKF